MVAESTLAAKKVCVDTERSCAAWRDLCGTNLPTDLAMSGSVHRNARWRLLHHKNGAADFYVYAQAFWDRLRVCQDVEVKVGYLITT